MRYSQGDGVHTSLSRLVLPPRVSVFYIVLYVLHYPRHGHVLSGTTVIKMMCVNKLYLQG